MRRQISHRHGDHQLRSTRISTGWDVGELSSSPEISLTHIERSNLVDYPAMGESELSMMMSRRGILCIGASTAASRQDGGCEACVDRGSWIADRESWIVDRGSWIMDRGESMEN